MTPEEAIRPLKELSARKKMADQCDQASANDVRLYHALDKAIEALEKQVPKPVIEEPWEHDTRFFILICPSCGSHSGCESSDGEALNFCNDCGQAIDWGE